MSRGYAARPSKRIRVEQALARGMTVEQIITAGIATQDEIRRIKRVQYDALNSDHAANK